MANAILPFEMRVEHVPDLDAVLDRAGAYFMGESPVQNAANEIARLLDEAGIPHAIAGALCLGAHGVVRTTDDVDILVSREGLERFKSLWLGRGYVNIRPGGKAVRDTVRDVKIDFLLTGDYPGDGRPKPIAFPDPSAVAIPAGRLKVVDLPRFVELKLAWGMTAPHRLQDLADVIRLIEKRALPRVFAEGLHPWVRQKFEELWESAQHPEEDY